MHGMTIKWDSMKSGIIDDLVYKNIQKLRGAVRWDLFLNNPMIEHFRKLNYSGF